jgi:type IV fimbrial biogenesis protein FimT
MLGEMMRVHTLHRTSTAWRSARGLTLVELLVVVAVVVILLMVAVPSFRDMILTQRHKAVHAELTTDLQHARSEAVSRSDWMFLQFGVRANGSTCYTIYTCSATGATGAASGSASDCECDCANLPCTGTNQEQRTVVADIERGISFVPERVSAKLRFDPRTGGMNGFGNSPTGGLMPLEQATIETRLDRRDVRLRAILVSTGRVSNCSPGSAVSGYPPC